jgi:hypothetical protein
MGEGICAVRLQRGAVELLAHTMMVLLILGASKIVEIWVHYLWGASPLLFGRIPVAYIFDGGNFALLVGFFVIGVPKILFAYFRGGHHG